MKNLFYLTLCLTQFFFPNLALAQNAADAYYDPVEMEAARQALRKGVGGQTNLFLMADRFEYRTNDGDPLFLWDGQGWFGGDINKVWFKTEGEFDLDTNSFEEAEFQALYSRAISPFFDFQFGIRQDFEPGPERTYGVIGIQGLAPQWFEIDMAAFISEEGDVSARIEAEYEILFTQRLILQPRVELNFAVQDVPELEIGSGLSTAEAGLRLRYEFKRELAPYVGVSWQSSVGDSADFARASGVDVDSVSFVFGLRAWF